MTYAQDLEDMDDSLSELLSGANNLESDDNNLKADDNNFKGIELQSISPNTYSNDSDDLSVESQIINNLPAPHSHSHSINIRDSLDSNEDSFDTDEHSEESLDLQQISQNIPIVNETLHTRFTQRPFGPLSGLFVAAGTGTLWGLKYFLQK